MISNVCAEDYQEFVTTTTAKKQQGKILKLWHFLLLFLLGPSLSHGRESPASVPDGRRSVQATRSRNPSGRRASLSAASSFADRLPYK